LERKKEIYEIASRHNVIILEDDPYYYLQYDYPLTPSYFSLDTDGRVMRFDSFSKVLSAGARIGVVTGPFELIDRLQMHQMSTILNPSGISQVILYHYLQKVGIDGFLDHCKGENVSLLYKKRSDVFVKILEKYLTGKATWNVPKGGMFCWIDLSPSNIIDSFELVSQKCINAGVILVPGQEFFPDSRKCAFVRASFSYSSEKDMDLGIQKLASLL
jgi:kynurenine/2-aminoadipate aminotransferase